ncbi:MAG TPA: Ig-like domain-containing protein, partial [Verrucomicrobiae bacterium]
MNKNQRVGQLLVGLAFVLMLMPHRAMAVQAPVPLGSVTTFGVLAGSTATSTGATTVNGDLGLSPGTAVTGFPPGLVTGTTHLGDPVAAQAQLDLTVAYNDAAGRTVGAIGVAGNLGGQTLTPGLYTSTSSLEISSGDLTLDAQGDANAVFIFQMASTLTTTSGRQVILSGGAQAANIFWQVGSSATLGTASVFKGNILALVSITVTTGAAVEGRLLARTGAVTLDSNIAGLAIPADTTPPTVTFTDPANAATGVAINKKIAATFSEAMDPLTISTATFTLNQGLTPVAGTLTYVGTTATFAPASNLAASTLYTATITTGVKDLAGNAMAGVFVWSFTTGAAPDTTAPTVSFAVPANAATGVPISQKIAATFSEAMDPLTISTTTFTLNQGSTPVPGTVSYAGVTATFTPGTNLSPLTAYTATVTTGTTDLAGNALASTFVWNFTTGATLDTNAPTVSFTGAAVAPKVVALNTKLAVAFSEAMDPLTINTATFTLNQGTTPVVGTVTYAGVTATFNPLSDLAPSTTYTATITTGARDLAGNALASQFVWSFTTGAAPDTTPPTVTLTFPANAATGVPINQNISATFSEAMDPLTTTTVTFTLNQGATPLVGVVTYAGVTATFNPLNALAPSTTYTATITTGTRDLAGNALASQFVWSFTTGAAPDTTPPTVTLTFPANAATGVPINQNISATFSEAMDPLTTTTVTFSLNQGPTPVVGTVTYAGVTATFNPLNALAPSTTYTATITTGTRDLAGNALANQFVWSFTTGATPDTTAPTVTLTVPANAATDVPINQNISATFSEAMDPLTISTATFTLNQGASPLIGTVTYVGTTATFAPSSILAANTVYGATITTAAKDLAGNQLASDLAWSFTTAATTTGQAPVVLGSATTFGVLAGSTVTSTGATTVNGDLGVSPGTAVTGFPPGIV